MKTIPACLVSWARLGVAVIAVQLLNHVQLLATPWDAAHQAPLFFHYLPDLLKWMSITSWQNVFSKDTLFSLIPLD